MILDISKAVEGVKYPFTFSVSADASMCDGREVEFLTPLHVSGTYVVENDVVEITFDAQVDLTCKCDRCLEDVKINHTAQAEYYYTKDGEDGTFRYEGYQIDISDAVAEALTFAFPSCVLCADDCKGLCPYCGVNRNKTDCDCEKTMAEKNSPFSILKQ